MRMSIEAFGDVAFDREILRVTHRAEDMRPAFEEVRKRFYELEKHQFDSQGQFSGGWAPLAPSTLEGKLRAGLNPNILEATGRLKSSVTAAGTDAVYHVHANDMFVGSNVPYGVFHQSTAPRTRLPRRPIVQIPDEEKREWIKVLQRFLVTGEV